MERYRKLGYSGIGISKNGVISPGYDDTIIEAVLDLRDHFGC
jgi:hypothetical protein